VTVDKPYDGSGGDLVLNMYTTGITNTSGRKVWGHTDTPVVFFDDPQEAMHYQNLSKTYEYSWEHNNGTFSFHWNDYAGDGFVFGPMPPSGWTINMQVERKYTEGLDYWTSASYDSSKNDVDYQVSVPIKKTQAKWGGVEYRGASCTDVCQEMHGYDCTACMADSNCKFSANHGGCIGSAAYVYQFEHRDAFGVDSACMGASKEPDLKVMKRNETLYPGTAADNTIIVRIGAEGLDMRCPCSELYAIFVVVYTWDMRQVAIAENIPVREGKRYTFVEIPGMSNATYYHYYAYVCMSQGTVMRDDCSPGAIHSEKLLYN